MTLAKGPPSVWSAHELVHLEDGQEDGDDDKTHHQPHGQDDDGLQDGGKGSDLGLHLGLVGISHLDEHLLQVSARLAGGDHVGDHRGEKPAGFQGRRDTLPFPHCQLRLLDGLGQELVVYHRLDDIQGIEDRKAPLQQGSQGPSKARHRPLEDDLSEQGQLQLDPVPLQGSLGCLQVSPDPYREEDGDADKTPPKTPEDRADPEQDPRGQGEGTPHLLKDLAHCGDDKGEEESHDCRADDHHKDGIGQGRPDAVFEPDLVLGEVCQAQQHPLEGTALFPRPNHINIEIGEGLAVWLQGIGKGSPLLDLLSDLGHHLLQGVVVRLLDDGIEGRDQGCSCLQQGRELTGDDGDILGAYPLEELGQGVFGLLGHVDLLPDVDREDLHGPQLGARYPRGGGVDDPLDLLPLCAQAVVFVDRHV